MTTKAQIIADLKEKYPTLRVGNDQIGYTDLSLEEYEATINNWADNEIAKAEIEKQELEKADAKETAEAKLIALGLDLDDLRALGL